MKFMMVALTLLMGLTMTSCLDSESNDAEQFGAVAKLQGTMFYYTFHTTDGWTITLSDASIAKLEANGVTLGQFSGEVVYFVYDTAIATRDEVAKTIKDVNLLSITPLNNPVEIVYGEMPESSYSERRADNDSIGNTPIITLQFDNGEKPSFIFDPSTLYLPSNYYISKIENYMTLVYYRDVQGEHEDGPTLYLRYHSKGNAYGATTAAYDTGIAYYFLKFYDLTQVLFEYETAYGTPSKVYVKTQESEAEVGLELATEKEYVVPIEVTTYE